MNRFKTIITVAFLITVISSLQLNASPINNETKVVSVFLESHDDPNYWSIEQREDLAKKEIQKAFNSWKKILSYENIKIEYFTASVASKLNRCDYKKDWETALSEYGKKFKTSGKYFLVFNPYDECTNDGYAQLKGKFASIRKISSTVIAHEFGHNLGFQHSGSAVCSKEDFSKLPKNCEISQYGDKTDVMGSGIVFDQSKMSQTQLSIVLKSPIAKEIRTGKYWISKDAGSKNILVGRLKLNDGYAFLEFDDATQNGGNRVGQDEKPGIQVRIVSALLSSAYSNSTESGIGTLLLSRLKGFDDYNVCQGICYMDSRFNQNEAIRLPFSKYSLKVLTVRADKAEIQITGSIK